MKPVPKDTAKSEVRHIPVGGTVTVAELSKDSLAPTNDSLPKPIIEMPKQGPEKDPPQPDPVPQPKPISKDEAVAVLHASLLNFCRMMGLIYIR